MCRIDQDPNCYAACFKDVPKTAEPGTQFVPPLAAMFAARVVIIIPEESFFEEGCSFNLRIEPMTFKTDMEPPKYTSIATNLTYTFELTMPKLTQSFI